MKVKTVNKKRFGFTLVELLVVISIISILTIITAGNFVESQKKSRDAFRKANAKAVSSALNQYFSDYGYFPNETVVQTAIGNESEFSVTDSGGRTVVYMKKMPKEKKTKQISYQLSSTGKSFRLYVNLENNKDSDCIPLSTCNAMNSGEYQITTGCCYVVTSSNIGVSGTSL